MAILESYNSRIYFSKLAINLFLWNSLLFACDVAICQDNMFSCLYLSFKVFCANIAMLIP